MFSFCIHTGTEKSIFSKLMLVFSMAWQSFLKSWVCPWPLERSKATTECMCWKWKIAELKMNPESLLALSTQLTALADKKPAIIQTERSCSFSFLFESLNSFSLVLICSSIKRSAFTALMAAVVPDTLSSTADTQTTESSAGYPHPFSSTSAVLCGAGP